MAELNARSGGRRRRTRNEINMVPFIDVMLVLLIIFMVSAPLLPTGVVDVPTVGKAKQAPEKIIEVVVKDADQVRLLVDHQSAGDVSVADLADRIKGIQGEAAGGPDAVPVIISAKKDVRYDEVVQIMGVLQKAHVARVGLMVRSRGG